MGQERAGGSATNGNGKPQERELCLILASLFGPASTAKHVRDLTPGTWGHQITLFTDENGRMVLDACVRLVTGALVVISSKVDSGFGGTTKEKLPYDACRLQTAAINGLIDISTMNLVYVLGGGVLDLYLANIPDLTTEEQAHSYCLTGTKTGYRHQRLAANSIKGASRLDETRIREIFLSHYFLFRGLLGFSDLWGKGPRKTLTAMLKLFFADRGFVLLWNEDLPAKLAEILGGSNGR